MDEVLLELGNPMLRVIKQGSWISDDGYRNPLDYVRDVAKASDHDARLFIAHESVSEQRALEWWKTFQGRLRKRLFENLERAGLFPSEIQAVMRSVNLYPPAQALKGIEQNEQALAKFFSRGNYPNLIEVGEEGAEGLYTQATKFIRQGYEQGSRVQVSQLVAKEGSDTFTLMHKATAEAEHAIEGIARENLEGYVQAIDYQVKAAQQALKEGNLDIAKKNLDRAQENIKAARRLAGVKPEGSLTRELDALQSQVDDAIERAMSATDDAAALLAKSRALAGRFGKTVWSKANVELAALENATVRSSIRRRAFIKGVLEGEGRWEPLRAKLEEASGSAVSSQPATARQTYGKWFVGLILLWELKDFPDAVRKEGAEKAGVRLATTVAGLANPTFGFAQLFAAIYMMTGELLVDWMSSYGYDAVASRQDCMELMAGIYTVPGREHRIEDRTCEQINDDRQLACRIYDQHQLRRHLDRGGKFRPDLVPPLMMQLLACHAKAASKHYDDVESKHDEGVANALIGRCLPQVLQTWIDSRQLVVSEIDALRQRVEEQAITVAATPPSLTGKGTVRLAVGDRVDLRALHQEIGSRAACLGGIHSEAQGLVDHLWSVNGGPPWNTYDKKETEVTFSAPGDYQVCVTVQYRWRIGNLPKLSLEDGLSGEAVRKACTTVSVTEPPKVTQVAAETPPPPPPPSAPPDVAKTAPSCSFEYSAWGECSRATRKQTRSVTARSPQGCVERTKPVLEQGCTPPPSEEEKRHAYLNCLCRCYSGWAAHIGVWYDPENKSVPECKSVGPCFGGAGAFGCTRRHFFGAPNECAQSCWEGVYGKGTYDAKKADAIRREANKKFKEPLKAQINGGKCPVHAQLGDIITLDAAADGGVPPHTIRWSGDGEAKDARFTFVQTRQPGSFTISATVTDSEGGTATASCTVVVDAVSVTIEKVSPAENTLPVGSRASFRAIVKSGTGDARGEFRYRWQPHPEVQFGDERNPQFETTSPSATATYTKMGTFPMSVNVVKKLGDTWQTVGESNQIPMQIVAPKLRLTVNPAAPRVGENVVVTVKEEPAMDDKTIGFWWEVKGATISPGAAPNTPNDRAWSFRPKDARPITVTVHGKSKVNGDDLGAESVTIAAIPYSIALSEPRYLQSKPRIWRCDTQLGGSCPGLVEVGDQQFAVFHDIFMRATVSPAADKSGLRFTWAVKPEGCTGGGSISDEIRINCSRTGSYDVNVTVRSSDGAELGSAARSIEVSVSDEMLKSAGRSKEAADKVLKAKELVAQGRLDEGLQLVTEAAGADPKNPEAAALQRKWGSERELVMRQLAVVRDLAAGGRFADATRELAVAQQLHGRYPPVIEAGEFLKRKSSEMDARVARARSLRAEGEALQGQGQLAAAIAKFRESLEFVPDPALQAHIAKLEGQIALDRQRQQQAAALWNEGRSLQQAGRAAEALGRYKESLKLWPDAANQQYVAALEAQLAQSRAQAAALWNEGRALQEGGRAREALARYKESLRLWPDAANERYVQQLEAALAAQAGAQTASPATTSGPGIAAAPPGAVNPVGLWRHAPEATWKITRTADGRYFAEESGLGNARGPAYWTPDGAFRIDYRTQDGAIDGYYEVRFAADGYSASGTVRELTGPRRTASTHWRRVQIDAPAGTFGGPTPPVAPAFYPVDLTPHGGKKGTPRMVNGIEVDDGSWIRLKATHEQRLSLEIPLPQRVAASAVAVVSNLDNAHYLKDGFVTTVLTVHTTTGDRTFEIKAGVHTSEWNRSESGGAEHAFPKDKHIGDKRWLAVFELPSGTVVTGLRFDHRDTDKNLYHVGAAPGFCLRGITLLSGPGGGSVPGGVPGFTAATVPPAAGGLLAHFPLDGNAQDTGGRGLHGRITGARPAADRFGVAGGALYFSGRDFVEIPLDINPNVLPRLTFTAWVRADEASPIRQVMSHDDGNFDRSLGIDHRGGGTGWSLFAGSGAVLGHHPVERGRWVFVAGVWDQPAGSVRLHVDDAVFEGKGKTGSGRSLVYLGKNPGFGEFFVGAIDEVRLYADALTPAQIRAIRNAAGGSAAAAPVAAAAVIYDNGNIGAVGNGPQRATSFTLAVPHVVTLLQTYHWNSGRGATPGTIALRDDSGRVWGPWQARGTPGQGGVPNANWVTNPNVSLPAGTYTVIDSDPASWAHNAQSQGAGFVRIEGRPAER
jgi:tetratricopeptide (TPR) repeat protein